MILERQVPISNLTKEVRMSTPMNNPIYRLFLSIVILVLSISSCAPAAMPAEREKVAYEGASAPAEAPASDQALMAPAPASGTANQSQVERMVIKNGNLSIVVLDPPESMDNISKMTEAMGGFVVTANLYNQEIEGGIQVPRGSISIRIPAERMNEAMERIKAESSQDPISENINSQDVTSEYIDIQSRVKNLEAAEAELTEIMKSANKTEDVLNVYNQLVQIREQIEVNKGQIQYYEQSVALSSISVELIADKAVQPLKVGGWQIEGNAKRAVQALINTLQFLVKAIIWIIILILPVLLIIYLVFVLPISLVLRAWKRRRRQGKSLEEPGKAKPAT
jgi:mannose/fructose/N-acetylgalactosamine-specific phosphotransferase system component IIB